MCTRVWTFMCHDATRLRCNILCFIRSNISLPTSRSTVIALVNAIVRKIRKQTRFLPTISSLPVSSRFVNDTTKCVLNNRVEWLRTLAKQHHLRSLRRSCHENRYSMLPRVVRDPFRFSRCCERTLSLRLQVITTLHVAGAWMRIIKTQSNNSRAENATNDVKSSSHATWWGNYKHV